ncbi:uncharacterized protein LOC132312015 [Cornus florida]|uniref:uncharacterized protein LOC132312015 n=1 Tax=Cornus florida TaxID=4283 RepID=UPI00289F2E6D|nr:uncharacterized protein LOC132312015 [Cornus florida]XP_059666204.1 uncharacterized protein LOC132312015 [Cornus florida]XP_059666205.1 uncharacterized protein LOC132312015 [Cornus florida]
MAATKVSLKLLIDAKAHKVLFAEAGKDFVDFLFNLLSLPVGTVIRLLTNETMVGSIGNLYKSIENLNEDYMQPNQNKDLLLKPNPPTSVSNVPLLLPDDRVSSAATKFYTCQYNSLDYCYHRCVTNKAGTNCPSCCCSMSTELPFVGPVNKNATSTGEGGYVRGLVTYMVTDDLSVTPMSMISGISMLNKCNVMEFDALQEKVVEIGMDEGLKLLKGSLKSKAVLTYVFLGKEEAKEADGAS